MTDSPIDLASLSIDDLRRELERRQRELESLIAKRARIAEELASLDARIREVQGQEGRAPAAAASRGRSARLALPRVKNSISLPDAIALEAEVGEVVTPSDIARRVLASGYQTNAAKFAMVVTNALSKDTRRFKRVGRGRYERIAG